MRTPNLTSLDLPTAFRSSEHQLARDFLSQTLPASAKYSRAVGFFSSSVFSVAPDAWRSFFEGTGAIDMVCSERLSRPDIGALEGAIRDRPRWRRRAWSDVTPGANRASGSNSDLLAWLVANDKLRLKIARPVSGQTHAMYHEKIGFFTDVKFNFIAISGSANESRNSLVANFERIDVFRSWGDESEAKRAKSIKDAFTALWENRTHGLEVISIAEAVIGGVLKIAEQSESVEEAASYPATPALPSAQEVLVPPLDFPIFPHQEAAIVSWAKSGGRGVLEMATGSGKTITSLYLASRLNDAIGPGLAVVIVSPFIHLVDQWIEVARRFGLRPIRCCGGINQWETQLQTSILALNLGSRNILSISVTNSTLLNPTFRKLLEGVRKPILLIADEVHNLGAPQLAAALPQKAKYRVGLSATPERWFDPAGTERINSYFGKVVFTYDLAEAIRDNVLTHYLYYPHLVKFSDEEFDEYRLLSERISRLMRGAEDDENLSSAVEALLIRRARLVGTAAGKLPKLIELLAERRRERHILVYCGDGRVSTSDSSEIEDDTLTVRQVDEAARIIYANLGMSCAKYTSATSPSERVDILKSFAAGSIQVLIAIKCLDEGVDVPSTRTAFLLASSTNPRQYVQRRGRVLRRHPGKPRAEVHDLVVVPPRLEGLDPSDFDPAQKLVRGQVRRIGEFASLADNGPVARRQLLDTMRKLGILADLGEEP